MTDLQNSVEKARVLRSMRDLSRIFGELIAYAAITQADAYERLRAEVDRLGDEIARMMGVTGQRWMRM